MEIHPDRHFSQNRKIKGLRKDRLFYIVAVPQCSTSLNSIDPIPCQQLMSPCLESGNAYCMSKNGVQLSGGSGIQIFIDLRLALRQANLYSANATTWYIGTAVFSWVTLKGGRA
jgi:hypothetical protein